MMVWAFVLRATFWQSKVTAEGVAGVCVSELLPSFKLAQDANKKLGVGWERVARLRIASS